MYYPLRTSIVKSQKDEAQVETIENTALHSWRVRNDARSQQAERMTNFDRTQHGKGEHPRLRKRLGIDDDMIRHALPRSAIFTESPRIHPAGQDRSAADLLQNSPMPLYDR